MSAWPRARLGDCAEIISGATPKTSIGEFWDGDVYWATPKDLSDLDGHVIASTPRTITAAGLRSCGASVLPSGSVLFSSRAPIGLVAVNTVPMATNQGFKSFIPRSDLLDSGYLAHWLRTNRKLLESLGNGATFKEVSKAVVSRVEIPLPPVPEQRRIAEVLDRADELRTKRREALGLLRDLTQSIFLEMFGDPDVSRPDLVPLETLCSRITDGTHQSPKWAENGVPFLFISNILSGEIDFDTAKHVSPSTHADLTRRCPIERGDVLYSTVGSYGIPAVVRTDQPFAFQRHLAHLKPRKSVEPDFLAAMLATRGLRRQADRAVRGVAQPTINLADVRKFRVVAASVAEQQRFVEVATRVRAQRGTSTTALSGMQRFVSSLQQRAFAGEL